MNITRKESLLLLVRFVPLLGLLYLFTDLLGCLFVGADYHVRAWFHIKVFLFLAAFSAGYLVCTKLLRCTLRQLGYIGYPIYLLVLGLCGGLTTPHDLVGYKIALIVVPFAAQGLRLYGKGLLRRYLRMVSRLTGGRFICKKSLMIMGTTLLIALLPIIGIYSLRGSLHFHLREAITEVLPTPFKAPEKPVYNPDFSDRRDPYRNYPRLFNDLNDTQLVAARANGTPRPLTMEEIEVGMYGLQHISTNKLYKVDPLTHSAPYLVPKAKQLLHDLGEAFQDSLYNRGYDRRHRFIVTSVYRTQDHINRLRRSGNVNASQNSCHQYGTTVDITYVRFDKPDEHLANDMKLQQLLYQTVYDMHQAGRCYVKYERKQSCLHITVR
ncbi:MAG: hypothetical protein IKV15_00095 [Bacteroidaceae bacterium]|nr:hypothetical protein [Bacteroidaceae bacterium]